MCSPLSKSKEGIHEVLKRLNFDFEIPLYGGEFLIVLRLMMTRIKHVVLEANTLQIFEK